jgi:hypothetical protein
MSAPAKRKVAALTITLLYFAMLCAGHAQNRYTKQLDLAALAICLVLMAIRSTLVLHDFVNGHRSDHDTLHRKWQRWLTDDYPINH